MSENMENYNKNKINLEFLKNRQFIDRDLIRYKEDENTMEFYELMKNGYMQMSQINLELSEGFESSTINLQYEFDGINEYEKWLCGVWIEWRLWL